MGYFRDDQPLYELILDAGQQAELDALWIAMDFDGAATARMYQQWVENQTSQGGGRVARRDAAQSRRRSRHLRRPASRPSRPPFSPPPPSATDVPVDPRADGAIRGYFGFVNDRLRAMEALHRAAAPKHVDALVAFAGRAYRRPLTATRAAGDPRRLCRLARRTVWTTKRRSAKAWSRILMSPDFLYRLDRLETIEADHAAVRLRARQPPELLPLVQPAGRRAARARRRRRPAPAPRHRGAGATHAPGSAGARARRRIRRQLARHPPLPGTEHGRSRALPGVHQRAAAGDVRGARAAAPRRDADEPAGPRPALRQGHLREPGAGEALRHAGAGRASRRLDARRRCRPATDAAASCRWPPSSPRTRLACARAR